MALEVKVTDKPKVLVVDDDLELLSIMKKFLEMKKVNVVVEEKGGSVEAILKKESFDLIILDVVLPDVNGIEILKVVKSKYPDQKVIVMTAMLSIENTISALREGAVEYLLKPFSSMGYIWTVIEEYL